MSAEKIRAALGLLSENPDDPTAWTDIEDAVSNEDVGDVLRELERARTSHERYKSWAAVTKLLGFEVQLTEDKQVAAAKQLELARVYHDELLQPDAAEEAFGRVLEFDGDNERAAEAVNAIKAARDNWTENVEHCLAEARNGDDPNTKARFLVSAADATYRYGDHDVDALDRVLEYTEQALELRDANRKAKSLRALVYEEREDWLELVDVLTDRVASARTKPDRVAAARRLAQISLKKLDDEDGAVTAYGLLLDLQPDSSDALSFLVDYYSRNEEWDHLVALYEDQIQSGAVKQSEEFGVWVQLAMLHWKTRERVDDAEPYFDKVRRLQPTHPGMLSFFRECCEKKGDSARLVTILTDAQRALEDGDRKRELLAEIAVLAEGQENARRAIDQYKTILRADPLNLEARDKLKSLYLQTESYNALVELYRQDLQRLEKDDAKGRISILRQIADVYADRAKSDTSLLTTLNQIIQLDRDDIDAVRRLTGVYESLGRWRDLLNMQQRLAGLTESNAERVTLLRAVARRWVEQFSNVQNAISAYEELLQATGDDAEARERLCELYKKRRSWPKLYELYQHQVELLDGEKRIEMMMEMASLAAERLGRGDEAIELLKRVLQSGSTPESVLDQLEKLAERQKDFGTVAQVLERRLETIDDEKAKLTLLQKLGGVYADKIGNVEAANDAWRRVLDVSPGHKRALRVLRQSFAESADWEGLDALYASQDDFEGLADFLSTTADRTKDSSMTIELSFRAADVYTDKLEAPERAVRSYERVLSIDEDNVRAAKALLPLYEREEKWSRLPGLYSVLLGDTDGVDEKIAILHKIAGVTGGPLANKAAALSYARRAYQLRPDEEGLARLQSWSEQSGEWAAFIEVVQEHLGAEGLAGSRARELRLMLANVYAAEVDKVDEAVQIYRELVEDDPSDSEAVGMFEELLRAADRRADLRWLFELKVDRSEAAAKSAALEDWATVEEEVFGEPERAVELLERSVAATTDCGSALNSLTRLLLAAEQFERAATVMMTHREALEGEDRLRLETRLAVLHFEHLANPDQSYEACAAALAVEPTHAPAVALLEELLDVEATRARAAETLENIYCQNGEHQKQADALRIRLENEESSDGRMDLCDRLAGVYEHELDDNAAAFEVTLGTLVEAATSLELWDRASRLAKSAGRPTDLAEAYRTHLGGESEAPLERELEVELCDRASVLHEDELGDAEGAVRYLNRILALDPANERAFERLKNILTLMENWDELEKLYRRRLDGVEDDAGAQINLLTDLALVAEEMMDDDAKAIAYHERALKLDPLHDAAGQALERLYARDERFTELAVLLEQRLETAGDDATAIELQLVDIYLHRLEQPGQVLDHLEAALRLTDAGDEARRYAEECLDIDELRQSAASLLDDVYEQRDEVSDLVRVVAIRLDGVESDDERRELLQRIATLRDERLKDDEGAFEALCLLAPLEPDDVAIRERLVEIGRRLSAHEGMASALIETANNCALPGMRGEILMEAAGLYGDQLDDSDKAIATYRRVLEIDHDDPMLVIPAAKALADIYEQTEQHEELAESLGKQVRLVDDREESAELYARIANLYEDVLENNDKAIASWKARLSDDLSDEGALHALERLYEHTEQWRELVEVLHHREQSADDGDERRRCMVKAASVLSDQLEETSDAINAWRAVVDDFGPEPDTLSALCKLYPRAERWEDLADVLDVSLSLTDDLDQRVELYASLGDVRREHLSDPHNALSAYREVLILEPSHEGARAALEAMLGVEDPEIRRQSAETIGPLYEADGDAERLLKVIDIEIESTFDPAAKLEKLRMAMSTAEDTAESEERVFDYAARGVREAIGEPSLTEWIETVERLGAQTERWTDLIELYEAVVDEILDADAQQDLRLRAGELARTMLEDEERSIVHYRAALESVGDDRRAMVALEGLYEETEQSAELKEILQLRCESAGEDEERVQLLHRIAELQSGPLEQPDEAIESYEQLIDIALDDDAVLALEKLYQTHERYEDLCSLYERELDADTGDGSAAIRVKLARICAEQLADTGRALDELAEALSAEPRHEEAVKILEQLLDRVEDPEQRSQVAELLEPVYLRQADWQRLKGVLEARLDTGQDPTERDDLLRRLAALYEEQLEDYKAALETVARRLREDPGEEEIWGEIERLGRVLGDGEEESVANIFAEALSEVGADDPNTAALSQRTGELFAAVGKNEDALKWLGRAFEFSPDSEELFEAIDELLSALGRHEQRVDHYRTLLDQVFDDDRRVQALHTVAQLQHQQLEQPEEAIGTYGELLDIDDGNETALDALAELFEQAERHEDLADLHERRALQHEDPEKAAPHWLALARLRAKEEYSRATALEHLRTIVDAIPWHEEAIAEIENMLDDEEHKLEVIEMLRPLYQRAEQWQGLIKLNDEQCGLADSDDEKAELLNDSARLWEDLGEDREKAFETVRQAYLLCPHDETTRDNLERLAEVLEAWDRLAATFREIVEAADDEFVKRPLLAALATICDEQLDDMRGALSALGQLSELDPSEPGPLERMDVLCMLLGDWDTLVVVLGRQADNEFDIEQKSALWRRIGAIKGDMLGDVDGAIDAFEQALELESDSLEALDRLIQLYAPRDASRMVALLEQRVESTPAEADDERHQLMVHAATVHEEQLDDRISAIAMLQRALDARPNDVSILSSLERLFHAEEAWDDLLDNLRTQADTTAESERRIELRNKIGDLSSSQYDDSIGALEQYRLVLDEVTDNAHALAATRKIGDEHEELRLEVAALLEPVLTELERHRELVEVMDMRFKAQQDPAERSQTLSSMSMLLEEQLDDAPGARDAILGALAETPEQASLHEDAARLCELTGQWQRYAEVLGTGANDSFDGELQVDLYRRLGRVCEERLDDQEGAIEAYKGALELSEEPAELLEALDRLYSSTGNTEQLVMVIQRRIDFDDSDAERAELHYRLATIQIQGLEDPVQGLATLQHVVELVPEHEGAREQLEALTENEELFEQVADVLDNVYRVMQDSAARAQLQSKRIGYTSDPQERLSQRLALAQMLESEAFDTVSAQRVIEQAIADAPQNVSLLDHLERLAEENAAGRDGPVAWRNAGAAVTNAVELGLESSDDASSIGAVRAHTLLVKVAGWLQDNADDVEGAEKALNQALQHNESSGQALSMLEAIQRDTGRERDLVATLLRMAALVQVGEADADRSANELRREAKIIAETALEDAVLAETIVRDMIRINDADVWALSELSSLLEAKGDHRELSDLLLRRIELCEHEDELRDLRHHAAIVASEKLGDDDAAIDLYEQAFEDDVSDSIAKEALRELYEKLERHSDMLRLLERLTDASEAPDERAQLRYQSAIICLDTLEAPTEGIEHLRAVLEEDQGHQDAVMRLSQVLENEGMDDQLAELLGRQIEVTRERGDEEAELGFRVKTAELYESRLNDPEKAIDAYVGILELDSDHRPALTALARLHEGQDSYAEAAAMYEKLLESAEADDVPRLAMKVRDLYVTGELPEEACRVVEAVLDRGEAIDGDAIGQLRDGLKSLYRTREAWDELAAIIAVEAGEAESDDERVELYRKAADIHSTKRDDHAAAAELLEKALALKEDDRDLMLAVCDEYTASGRGQAVVEMLQRIVDSFGGRRSKELADIHHRIASAYLADDNEALALSELELARKMDPGSVRILYQLGKLSLRMADADDGAAAEHLKRAGNNFRSLLLQKLAADSLVTKAQVFLHLAQVNEREGDRKKAIQMLERALSNDKNFEPAQQYLDELRG